MIWLRYQLSGSSNTTSLFFDIKKDRGACAPRSHSSPNRFVFWLRPYFFLAAFFAFLRFAGAFFAAAFFLRFAAMIFSLVRYYFLRFGFNSLFSVELEVNFIAVLAGT